MDTLYRDEVLADGPSFYLGGVTAAGVPTDISGGGTVVTPNGVVPSVSSRLDEDAIPAWSFPGATANYLSAADGAPVDLGDGPFTLEAWVTTRTPLTTAEIFNKGPSGYEWIVGSTGFVLSKSDVGETMRTNFVPAANVLYHLIARRQGDAQSFVVNAEDRTGALTNGVVLADTAIALNIGRYHSGGFPWDGLIGHAAIYKAILPDARCEAHFKAGLRARASCTNTLNFPRPPLRS